MSDPSTDPIALTHDCVRAVSDMRRCIIERHLKRRSPAGRSIAGYPARHDLLAVLQSRQQAL
jgi:hypothetical protein